LVFRAGDVADLARAIGHARRQPPARDRLVNHISQFSLTRTVETIAALSTSASSPEVVRTS
jgi:hypothetical protein